MLIVAGMSAYMEISSEEHEDSMLRIARQPHHGESGVGCIDSCDLPDSNLAKVLSSLLGTEGHADLFPIGSSEGVKLTAHGFTT